MPSIWEKRLRLQTLVNCQITAHFKNEFSFVIFYMVKYICSKVLIGNPIFSSLIWHLESLRDGWKRITIRHLRDHKILLSTYLNICTKETKHNTKPQSHESGNPRYRNSSKWDCHNHYDIVQVMLGFRYSYSAFIHCSAQYNPCNRPIIVVMNGSLQYSHITSLKGLYNIT